MDETMDIIYKEKQDPVRKADWYTQASTCVARMRLRKNEWRAERALEQEGAGAGLPREIEQASAEATTRNRASKMEQCDAVRAKCLPTHVKAKAAKNCSVLCRFVASRAKSLAADKIAVFTFQQANSALRGLQLQGTTDKEAMFKFQQANSILQLAEEQLRYLQLKAAKELAEEQLRDLQLQVATDKGTGLKFQQASSTQSKRPHIGTYQALASHSHGTARDIAIQLDTQQRELADRQAANKLARRNTARDTAVAANHGTVPQIGTQHRIPIGWMRQYRHTMV
jgi:hypothetical protein